MREEFVLSTKVGRYFEPGSEDRLVYDYSRDGARRALDQSLTRLGLDRADIVLIHDIDRWTHGEHQPTRFGEALDGGYRALSESSAQLARRTRTSTLRVAAPMIRRGMTPEGKGTAEARAAAEVMTTAQAIPERLGSN